MSSPLAGSDTVRVVDEEWPVQLTRSLHSLFQTRDVINVAIYGNDFYNNDSLIPPKALAAHACVLMAGSRVLRAQLTDNPIQGCHMLEMSNINIATWKHVLHFIYTGTMPHDVTDCGALLEAARSLDLHPLVQLCQRLMRKLQASQRSPQPEPPTSQPVFPGLSPTKNGLLVNSLSSHLCEYHENMKHHISLCSSTHDLSYILCF